MTASLLASKGQAEPSHVNGAAKYPPFKMFESCVTEPPRATLEPAAAAPLREDELHAGDGAKHGKLRRVMVAFTAEEYERLGIAAVKRNVSRHQLVREAMDLYFGHLRQDFACPCLTDASFCNCRD
jgi:hypothetical protein